MTVKVKPKHPVKTKRSDAIAEDADRNREKRQKGITKTSTLVKAGSTADGTMPDVGGTMVPTVEQLAKINEFTRKEVTADEVVAFSTLSMNDLPDRDYDRFVTDCVKGFAELPQPFSPIGKSYMTDHEYKIANARGRIFDTAFEKVGGVGWLTNEIYVPNTPQYHDFIEGLDFGINWAVSVGVVIGGEACTVCGAGFSSWGYWCMNGHDKGLYYDPNSEEEDAWGWPLPVEPTDKGAILCIRDFTDPRDFYELSQVFLGAQFDAALKRGGSLAKVKSAMSASSVPVIGLSADESEHIKLPHEIDEVVEARRKYAVEVDEDGVMTWTDDQNIVRTFDPADPESGVLTLGKKKTSTEKSEEDDDAEHEVPDGGGAEGEGGDAIGSEPDGEGSGAEVGQGDAEGSPVTEAPDEDDLDEEEDDDPDPDEDDDEGEEEEDDTDDTDEDEDDEANLSEDKQVVLARARKSGLSDDAIKAIKAAPDSGSEALLSSFESEVKALRKQVEQMTPRAELGDAYVKEIRADAVEWYVRSHTNGEKAVDTSNFEKLLDKCGDDIELLRSVLEEQQKLARQKFPKKVRRSSVPSDPNTATTPGEIKIVDDDSDPDTSRAVDRLHS